ncbi:SDR family NAD(P)-dependent oxidoreductase [Paraglaciecola arctica]|uniref:SDR family NAD(P)-dependent oxidoreductase n=1 Tax=Paraglaciecola arctica TaxID=1128911 RepID=UPI001C06C98A|nr:SDR family NAD(P)-dependent oxidoreductase [Paraglaciecola arctica]MBU3004073.1 SDR family NAD(P)-dependent oxidoreductase [Paraglaciecola arctica]
MGKLDTALITGASEGIGRSFAEIYAKNGHDLVLVARNQAKLEEFAQQLQSQYLINVEVFAADLIPIDAAQKLFSAITLKGINVDILVNNAGMMQVEKLSLSDTQQLNNLLQLNIQSLVNMTQQFVKPMLARGQGKIVNIGSIASFMPTPNFAAYGASKAFVLSFTEGIAEELRGTGVTVTCVCPGMTETKMLSHADGLEKFIPKFLKADPMELAAQAYKASMKGDVIFLDKIANKLLVQWATHYPKWLVRGVNGLFARFN